MILYTTLNELKKHEPCTDGYRKLLKHIGLDYPVDKPIDLLTILESNGLDDTLWSLRAAMPEADRDRIARLFACDCAESVLHLYEEKYPNDNRPRHAIETARKYALGKATQEELKEASASASAAWSAAWSADAYADAYAAWSAARSAAWSADAYADAYAAESAYVARSASAYVAESAYVARSASAYVARSASAYVARSAERAKQTETLRNYLRGEK